MERDLVVFSHLRWNWVWQRPQHIVSRLANGRRVWFVEEPLAVRHGEVRLATEACDGGVSRVWLEVPGPDRHIGFEAALLEPYAAALQALLPAADERVAWLYSPLALQLAQSLDPNVVVFDVMDDLTSFKDAAPELVARHHQALRRADVVFAGGRTLHCGVAQQRPDAHLFPSGVEPEHYRAARGWRSGRDISVAGYVGVIDERLDLDLVDGLATQLPDWEIQMVGPVAKIDPADLPQRPNLRYLGPQPYDRLPEVMGGFDVALMPFALNESTRSISPTKTLEYLAAGLPVVSTRVDDVVASFGGIVDLQDTAAGFAEACRRVRRDDLSDRDRQLEPLLEAHHWDTIAAQMERIVVSALARPRRLEMPA